jgi:hypothetical protein
VLSHRGNEEITDGIKQALGVFYGKRDKEKLQVKQGFLLSTCRSVTGVWIVLSDLIQHPA